MWRIVYNNHFDVYFLVCPLDHYTRQWEYCWECGICNRDDFIGAPIVYDVNKRLVPPEHIQMQFKLLCGE